LLKVNHLFTSFHQNGIVTHAVNDISFHVAKGKTLGIVGESGSGKSVTSMSIMRLLDKNVQIRGEILWQDNEIEKNLLNLNDAEIRKIRGRQISMIFQEPMTSLNPVFKCGHQVAEALQLHLNLSKKEAKERTIELFNEVLLPRPESIFDTYPHQISGGQKQRVMIAMAISCNPKLLIADEPTTALDVTVQKSILALLRKLREKHQMSMIFITHDLGVISELADDVLVMYRGKQMEYAPVKEIFSNPQHPYTKSLLACRPPLNTRPQRLPVVADFLEVGENGELKAVEKHREIKLVEKEERVKMHEKLYRQPPILKIENLEVTFTRTKGVFSLKKEVVKAVDNISFEVYPGETFGLVGESGCGKTTLGRSILRLIEFQSGKVFFQGMNLADLSAEEMRKTRQHLQIIFQDPYSSLNPRRTVGEAIMEPMAVHGLYSGQKEREQKAKELLQKVGLLEEHFYRYPHQFSGGQRQRVCIARTLSVQPRFIICDESVSALDVSVQAQVLNLLNDLKKDFGLSYIFISHDLSVVKYMCDRMMVMNKGKLVELGESDALYQNPQSEYTRNLIEAIPG
jgi:peptide/nickel transport system ATP-binding protein